MVCGLLGAPSWGQNTDLKLCVVVADTLEQEAHQAMVSALKIEQRKNAIEGRIQSVTDVQDCHPLAYHLIFVSSEKAILEIESFTLNTYEAKVSSLEPWTRMLSRAVMNDVQRIQGVPPLFDLQEEIVIGSQIHGVVEKEPPYDPRWFIRLGGAYLYQPQNRVSSSKDEEHPFQSPEHLAGPQLETGMTFLNRRLAVALTGGYRLGEISFAQEVREAEDWQEDFEPEELERLYQMCERGDREACLEFEEIEARKDDEVYTEEMTLDFQTSEVVAMARTGKTWGAWQLRGGLGLGWRHQNVNMTVKDDSRIVERENLLGDSGVLALDAALLWQFTKIFHAGVFVGGRSYFGHTGTLYKASDFFTATPFAVGTHFAVGANL